MIGERRAARSSELSLHQALPPSSKSRANPCEQLEQLQGRIRAVHKKAQLGGDAYHAELDAIATDLGRVKLEIAGWVRRDDTTWRAAPRRS